MLSPDQKIEWKGFGLYQAEMGRLTKVSLGGQQTDQIRALCNDLAKQQTVLQGTQKDRDAALKDLRTRIDQQVLTQAQRDELAGKASSPPTSQTTSRPSRAQAKRPRGDVAAEATAPRYGDCVSTRAGSPPTPPAAHPRGSAEGRR